MAANGRWRPSWILPIFKKRSKKIKFHRTHSESRILGYKNQSLKTIYMYTKFPGSAENFSLAIRNYFSYYKELTIKFFVMTSKLILTDPRH